MSCHPALLRAWLITLLALCAGCATTTPPTAETPQALANRAQHAAAGIGPYRTFHGRLVVITPKRRWQALIEWHADHPKSGDIRLTHAASGLVMQFRWLGAQMVIRDNHNPRWRNVEPNQLTDLGFVLTPAEMAAILLNHMPERFQPTGDGRWESRRHGELIRLQWLANAHKLTISNIRRGQLAILIIQP